MNEKSEQIVQRLANINFFSNVGSAATFVVENLSTVLLHSWDEAISLRGSDLASDAFTEASSRLTRRLSAEFRERYREWNEIAKRHHTLFEKFVFPKVYEAIDSIPDLQRIENGRDLLKDFVRWDLLHYSAEQAYSEFVKPQFYSCIQNLYEAGHFPCNWDEVWPNGKIDVF